MKRPKVIVHSAVREAPEFFRPVLEKEQSYGDSHYAEKVG
jgi:hypothetical protein